MAICQLLFPFFCMLLAPTGWSADETFDPEEVITCQRRTDLDAEKHICSADGAVFGVHGDRVGRQKCSQHRLIDKWLVMHAHRQLINRKHSFARGAESGRGLWENIASSVCTFLVVLETGWHAFVYIRLVPFGLDLCLPFSFHEGSDTHFVEFRHNNQKKSVCRKLSRVCDTYKCVPVDDVEEWLSLGQSCNKPLKASDLSLKVQQDIKTVDTGSENTCHMWV